jgi:hypothetical protein
LDDVGAIRFVSVLYRPVETWLCGRPLRCGRELATWDDFKDLLTSWAIDAAPFHPASLVEVR